MQPVALGACGLVSAAGSGLAAFSDLLASGRSALKPITHPRLPAPVWLGRVAGLEDLHWPAQFEGWDSRATRLAWLGLLSDDFLAAAQQACARWGAHRVGLVLGTSASTIAVSEAAYRSLDEAGGFAHDFRHPRLNTLHAVTDFVQRAIGLSGPAVTVSTACSSSAKAFASAQRWLALDLVDAVVVAGVDAVSDSVLFGFHALQLVSPSPCRPFDAQRQGISVGEAAGFVLLQRGAGDVLLLGHGESNDAHHMSAPHPQGLGAEQALSAALTRAGCTGEQIQALQLHGTGTLQNDAVEAALVARCYGPDLLAGALKGALGHTMGAAGILGALACVLSLREGLCGGSCHTTTVDPALPPRFALQLQRDAQRRPVTRAASHAFGFGGNNAVLVFGAGDHG